MRRALGACAVLLCLAATSCTRGAAKVRGEVLTEGKGTQGLLIDQTTLPEALRLLGLEASSAPQPNQAGVVEVQTPTLWLSFVPAADAPSELRLYSIRAPVVLDGQLGRTQKGIGPFDSRKDIEEAYGAAQGEWVQMNQRILYYEEGVLFTVQHPKQMSLRPADYAALTKQLGKQPSEEPDSMVVTGIQVVRPFSVLRPGQRAMGTQRCVTSAPETDLKASVY